MKYVQAKGLDLSAFALGTVQLGMQYGLGEDSAKPSEEKAFSMLDAAMELGINSGRLQARACPGWWIRSAR